MPIFARFALCAVLATTSVDAFAAEECPTAQTGQHGFVVERDTQSKTDVFHADASTVRTAFRYRDKTVLETTQFQGVFQLERLEQGKRVVFVPKSDLARLFPLKPGQKIRVESDVKGENRTTIVALAVTGRDTLYIGPCKYEVLKIERSESRGADAPQFIDTDYYSPELKLIIGREYKESGGRTNLIKFDRIYPIKP